jgi:hypothetical protein
VVEFFCNRLKNKGFSNEVNFPDCRQWMQSLTWLTVVLYFGGKQATVVNLDEVLPIAWNVKNYLPAGIIFQ